MWTSGLGLQGRPNSFSARQTRRQLFLRLGKHPDTMLRDLLSDLTHHHQHARRGRMSEAEAETG